MPDAGILATVLLVIGLFLLGLEFFIPSFGMIGTLAGISLVVSLWSANKAWGSGINPPFFWSYVFLLVAGIPGTIIGSFYAIQHTGLGKSIVLQPPAITPQSNSLDVWIGKKGISQTPLTPGGMVVLEQQRFHAESLGMLVDPQTPVIVVGVSGNRLVVRPATQQELLAPVKPAEPIPEVQTTTKPEIADLVGQPQPDVKQSSDAGGGMASEEDKLDFDIPEDYTA